MHVVNNFFGNLLRTLLLTVTDSYSNKITIPKISNEIIHLPFNCLLLHMNQTKLYFIKE